MLSLIIGIAGTICAGKLTILNALKQKLETCCGFEDVETVVEDLTIISELIHPDHFTRQLYLVHAVTNRMIQVKDRKAIAIVHRCIYDSITFMKAYISAGLAPKVKAEKQIRAWRENAKLYTDLLVLVKTPANLAFARAKNKFGTMFELEDRDPVFKMSFFRTLDKAYQELEVELNKTLKDRLVIVDGSKSFKKNASEIAVVIKKIIDEDGGNQERKVQKVQEEVRVD